MEDKLGGIKLEKHGNVHEVSLSLLVNLEAVAVAVNVEMTNICTKKIKLIKMLIRKE